MYIYFICMHIIICSYIKKNCKMYTITIYYGILFIEDVSYQLYIIICRLFQLSNRFFAYNWKYLKKIIVHHKKNINLKKLAHPNFWITYLFLQAVPIAYRYIIIYIFMKKKIPVCRVENWIFNIKRTFIMDEDWGGCGRYVYSYKFIWYIVLYMLLNNIFVA